MDIVIEGACTIRKVGSFYNPAQVYNRDISIVALNAYSRMTRKDESGGIEIFEALGASGIRSIRYAKEIRAVKRIVCNDLDKAAVEVMKANFRYNEVDIDKCTVSNEDCVFHMENHPSTYDLIDLDPFGTSAPFLDSAMRSVRNGGMLAITFTDSRVLVASSNQCFLRYGSVPAKSKFHPEQSLRIILHCVAAAAKRKQKCIVPMLSLSMNFYYRLFVVVFDSPQLLLNNCDTDGLLLYCGRCTYREFKPLLTKSGTSRKHTASQVGKGVCHRCQVSLKIYGPLWLGELHDDLFLRCMWSELSIGLHSIEYPEVMKGLLASCMEEQVVGTPAATALYRRIVEGGMLSDLIRTEKLTGYALPESESRGDNAANATDTTKNWPKVMITLLLAKNVPLNLEKCLYYHIPTICGFFKMNTSPWGVIHGALARLGFTSSKFHNDPTGIKTDAPSEVVMHVFLEWKRRNSIGDHSFGVRENESQAISTVDQNGDQCNDTLNEKYPMSFVEYSRLFSDKDDISPIDILFALEQSTSGIPRFPENPSPNWGPLKSTKGWKRRLATKVTNELFKNV